MFLKSILLILGKIIRNYRILGQVVCPASMNYLGDYLTYSSYEIEGLDILNS